MKNLKQRVAAGAEILVDCAFNSPPLVEYLGKLGFTSVLIDCEHGAAGIERVEELTRAARASRVNPIVRTETHAAHAISRYLDCGAEGIMVPMVDTPDMAREIVRTIRYARPQTYEEILIVAMIESREAILKLPQIMAVEGIDIFFLARVDLSKSLGHGGDKSHPAVLSMIDDAVTQLKNAGLQFGLGGDLGDVSRVVATGAHLILVNSRAFLNHGAQVYLTQAGKHIASDSAHNDPRQHQNN